MTNDHCSFCGKTRRQVRKLINGKEGCICDECVSLCVEILNEEAGISAPAGQIETEIATGVVRVTGWAPVSTEASAEKEESPEPS